MRVGLLMFRVGGDGVYEFPALWPVYVFVAWSLQVWGCFGQRMNYEMIP